jgi:Icc-related predicted phosphoesterase
MATIKTKKTRIVCISDTHNQTPKLPPGDILIHAGDLTNQGSYSELKKTIEWLENTSFAAKIVVAGNHDITLDPPFFRAKESKWKWASPQDPEKCRKLLLESKEIIYLEHEAVTIYLEGKGTCVRVFGSPFSPGRRGWAFQYWGEEEARDMWETKEMEGCDVVVTHTPAYGHGDSTMEGERAGCVGLKRRLEQVRPMIHLCGHIHDGRGVERVSWKDSGDEVSIEGGEEGAGDAEGPSSETNRDLDSLVESVEHWTDPGAGNKKISLVDLTKKSGREMEYKHSGRGVPRHIIPDKFKGLFGQPGQSDKTQADPPEPHPAASLEDGALSSSSEAGVETWRRKAGSAIECRTRTDVGRSKVDPDTAVERSETLMINAAFLSPRVIGKASTFNKPIVVDVDLPIWQFASEVDGNVQ